MSLISSSLFDCARVQPLRAASCLLEDKGTSLASFLEDSPFAIASLTGSDVRIGHQEDSLALSASLLRRASTMRPLRSVRSSGFAFSLARTSASIRASRKATSERWSGCRSSNLLSNFWAGLMDDPVLIRRIRSSSALSWVDSSVLSSTTVVVAALAFSCIFTVTPEPKGGRLSARAYPTRCKVSPLRRRDSMSNLNWGYHRFG